jgi:hypothetical protein
MMENVREWLIKQFKNKILYRRRSQLVFSCSIQRFLSWQLPTKSYSLNLMRNICMLFEVNNWTTCKLLVSTSRVFQGHKIPQKYNLKLLSNFL